ncbi:MAG: hypothetical protein MRY49_00760 [Candidatus Pacebacteria bacterium]|nr:hypothetical protein [Candidatus Paceibacterota bacterium]
MISMAAGAAEQGVGLKDFFWGPGIQFNHTFRVVILEEIVINPPPKNHSTACFQVNVRDTLHGIREKELANVHVLESPERACSVIRMLIEGKKDGQILNHVAASNLFLVGTNKGLMVIEVSREWRKSGYVWNIVASEYEPCRDVPPGTRIFY